MPSSSACTTSPRYSLCVRVLPGDLAAGLAASARPDPGLGPLVPSPAVALIERVLCPSAGPASERARRGRLLWGGGSDSGTAVRWFRLPWPRLPCPRRP